MRKVGAVALPVVCFVLASCSMLKGPELFDVTGCGEIKWGMTLAQANSLLGSRAKLTTDPKNGNYLEVKMMIGDVELSGFVGTKSARINGVHLAYLHEPRLRDVSQEMFERLTHILTAKYGPPSVKSPDGRIWFWH